MAMQRACQPDHPVIGLGGLYRVYEEAVMTVGHILSQKGSAVVTAKPEDTVHAVGKLLMGHEAEPAHFLAFGREQAAEHALA